MFAQSSDYEFYEWNQKVTFLALFSNIFYQNNLLFAKQILILYSIKNINIKKIVAGLPTCFAISLERPYQKVVPCLSSWCQNKEIPAHTFIHKTVFLGVITSRKKIKDSPTRVCKRIFFVFHFSCHFLIRYILHFAKTKAVFALVAESIDTLCVFTCVCIVSLHRHYCYCEMMRIKTDNNREKIDDKDNKDDYFLISNIDVRACYKPSEKVRIFNYHKFYLTISRVDKIRNYS